MPWAAGAAILALTCCIVAFVTIAASLHRPGVNPQRAAPREILALEQSSGLVTRSLLASVATSTKRPIAEPWRRFADTLRQMCGTFPATAEHLVKACADNAAALARLENAILAFAHQGQPLPPQVVDELLLLRGDIGSLAAAMAAEADRLIDRLVDDYARALLVLTICTVGFSTAGGVLILLLSRSVLAYYGHWRKAIRTGADALASRNQLQEIIETLPAGIAVYDARERLLAFNSAASSTSPALKEADSIGSSYGELARRSAERLEAAGHGPQPFEQWIDRFRARRQEFRQQPDTGRWFEWSEKVTPSGLIIGLRVDVTSSKRQELKLQAARSAAERARALYQGLVESLSDMVFSIDEDGRFSYVSPGAVELLNAPTAAIVGSRLQDWIAPQDRQDVLAANGTLPLTRGLQQRAVRCRMRTLDGETKPVELRYSEPRRSTSRAACVGIFRDVTDLERARAEYETLVASLADVVYRLDVATGTFTFVSAAAEQVLGRCPEQIVGTHFRQYVAADSIEVVTRRTLRPYHPDDVESFGRLRMLDAAGKPREVEVRARRRLDESGRVVSIGLIRDVEERVRLEQRLNAEMARLTSIVDSAGALLVLADGELNILMANREFTNFTGLEIHDAVGKKLPELLARPLPPRLTERTQYAVKTTAAGGHERLLSITATPSKDQSGQVTHVVLIGVDETMRREVEQVLHDLERFATVGEMAGTMAHEISQPLQAIDIACASALSELDEPTSSEAGPELDYIRKKLGLIASQVRQSSRIMGELRSFVRGTVTAETAPFDANQSVRTAIELMSNGLRLEGVSITQQLQEHLPGIVGSSSKLEQILINLFNNARDAGARTIEVHTSQGTLDHQRAVRIAVLDTGPGVPEAVMPKLFHSFVTTKPRGKGTGLGLRICRRIVEEMGGRISVANRREGGACFEMLFPAVAATGDRIGAEETRSPRYAS